MFEMNSRAKLKKRNWRPSNDLAEAIEACKDY
jgi:hypothetical protein